MYPLHLFSVLVIISLLLLPSGALAAPDSNVPPSQKPKIDFTLTLLQNNDGETKLTGAPSDPNFGGVARFKTLVDKLRAEALKGRGKRGVILLASGDNFIPGPQFDASLAKGVPFYDTIAMDLIGFDALAVGNHEFDLGPDIFADFIQGFCDDHKHGKRHDDDDHGRKCGIPLVSANLDFSQEPRLQEFVDDRILVKSLIIKERGENIGVVGVTTPLLPAISSPRNVVVDPDYTAAVQREVDRLTRKKVNKIILFGQLQGINTDFELASQLRGVDIIISGGGQELLANTGNLLVPGDVNIFGTYPMYATGADGASIPVVTTPGDYKYVGRLVVNFDKKGKIISVDPISGPVRVAGGSNPDAVKPDPKVQALVVEPVLAYIESLATTVVGTSQVALEGRRAPGVRTQETNLGNLMADSLLWQANELAPAFGAPQAQVAFQNGGGIRNNTLIPPGDITELTLSSIAPFLNFVAIVPDVPPAQFKELMENGVSAMPTADGRFPHIAGFTLVYDTTFPAQVVDNAGNVLTPGSRVREIRLADGTYIVQNGEVVTGAPNIHIATIDFLARGGDQYPFRGVPFFRLGGTYLQALRNYLTGPLGGVITPAQYPEGGEGRILRLH